MSETSPPRQPVVVRSYVHATPTQLWQLFTEGEHLSRWFCNACDSDRTLGGYVHAAWLDEHGEPWERIGTWTELNPPSDDNPGCFATLSWMDGDETLRFAAAPSGAGSMLTVISPLPQTEVEVRDDVLTDATTQAWQRAFELIDELAVAEFG